MTDSTDDSSAGTESSPGWRSSGGGDPPAEPMLPTGWLRGVGVVVVAVVIGALLMPSATRAPLGLAARSTPTTTAGHQGATGPGHTATTTPRTTTTGVLPGASAIHVLVANGTSITALAGGTAAYLRSRGFVTLAATNSSQKVSGTQVYAASGQQVAATVVVNALGIPSNAIQPASAVAPVASTGGATVVVIAGPDLARFAPTSTSTSRPVG
ncbi:MAG TPA: LytR C-terminal domain-containing protein [Acidimicrobiales bacterium]|nr:LytR C-terminal domain-containing protein [Acidimicrobiales bacterium]